MSKPSEKTLEMMQQKNDIFADIRATVTGLVLEGDRQLKNAAEILAEEEALLPLLDIEKQAVQVMLQKKTEIAEKLDNIADDGERTKRLAEYNAWLADMEAALLLIRTDPDFAKAQAVVARRQGKETRKVQEREEDNSKLINAIDKTEWQTKALAALDTVHERCNKLYGRNEGNHTFWRPEMWVKEARIVLCDLLKSYGVQPEGAVFNSMIDLEMKRLQAIRLEIKNNKRAEREAAKKAAETPKVETKAEEPTMSEVISTINDVPLAEPVVEDKPTKKGNKKGGRKPPVDKEDEAGFEKAIAGKNRRNAK